LAGGFAVADIVCQRWAWMGVNIRRWAVMA
jgi:hypothetical protein